MEKIIRLIYFYLGKKKKKD